MKDLSIYILLILGLYSCTSSSNKPIEKKWDKAAHWAIEKGDSIIIADTDKIKTEIDIPLNLLTEDYQVIKLDKEANLTHTLCDAFISDNFIAISCYSYHPLKLFKRDGTFIREIGMLGSERGQYDCICDVQIDELNNKIYILPAYLSNSDRILVYSIEGKFLQEIPLINNVRFGGNFKLDVHKNEITIINTTTKLLSNPFRIWIQDMNGNLIQGIHATKEKIDYAISSTISLNHTKSIETFLLHDWNSSEEYLYHYNKEKNKLVPKFQVQTKENRIYVYELPLHFIIEYKDTYKNTQKLILDKSSLKGCQFTGLVTPEGLLLEQFGILLNTHDGYFSLVELESQILQKIKRINRRELTKKQDERLKHLQFMIEEDVEDGYLLFMAKFKTKK